MSMAPDTIPDLELWLDADQITGLSDGDPVGTWSDASGNGNDYVATDSSITYETGELNGLPIVQMTDFGFDGSASLTSPFSLFYVGRFTEGGSLGRVAIEADVAPPWFLGPNAGTWRWANQFSSADSGVTANTDWVIHGVIQEVLTTREVAPLAGGIQYVYDLDSNALPAISSLVRANDPGVIALGRSGLNGADYGGDFAEIVAYSRNLSVTERVGLTDYFREKWGGIVASSAEDTDIAAVIAREAVTVGVSADPADAEMLVARQAVTVAHHFPEALTEGIFVRLGVVVAISRPHGWGIHDDPPL